MKATAHKAFLHDQLGRVEAGEFTVTAEQANSLRHLDFVEIHETKPRVDAVETKPERIAPATKHKG